MIPSGGRGKEEEEEEGPAMVAVGLLVQNSNVWLRYCSGCATLLLLSHAPLPAVCTLASLAVHPTPGTGLD